MDDDPLGLVYIQLQKQTVTTMHLLWGKGGIIHFLWGKGGIIYFVWGKGGIMHNYGVKEGLCIIMG